MLGKLEGLITLESLKEQGLIPQMIRINIIRMMRIISNNIISDEIDIISDDDIIINDENNSYQRYGRGSIIKNLSLKNSP